MRPPLPLTNLYPRLTSFASLHAAALQAQRGKRYRPAVLAFNARLEAQLFRLQEELRGFTYSPGPYRQFEIRDPKRRLISAAPYRDRVVPGRLRVRNHNLRKGKRRLSALQRGVTSGAVAPEVARASLQSWNAHLAHGHTWRLRRRLFTAVPFAEGLP